MRVLKNTSTAVINKNVRGKIFVIKPKGSLTITDSQADEIANDLLQTYGFLKDITPKETHPAPKTEEEIKEVVKPAQKKVKRAGRGRKKKHDNS